MGKINYTNDVTKAEEVAQGSDSRLNVSSRADGRGYYNSRDASLSFSALFDDANATAADHVFYLKNTNSNGKHLVLRSIGVNCEAATSTFKLSFVSGTPVGSTAIVPVNLNRANTQNAAAADCSGPADSSSTPMTGLTIEAKLDCVGVTGAFGHSELKLNDQVRLGPNDAISIQLDSAAAVDVRCFGVVYFYYE